MRPYPLPVVSRKETSFGVHLPFDDSGQCARTTSSAPSSQNAARGYLDVGSPTSYWRCHWVLKIVDFYTIRHLGCFSTRHESLRNESTDAKQCRKTLHKIRALVITAAVRSDTRRGICCPLVDHAMPRRMPSSFAAVICAAARNSRRRSTHQKSRR